MSSVGAVLARTHSRRKPTARAAYGNGGHVLFQEAEHFPQDVLCAGGGAVEQQRQQVYRLREHTATDAVDVRM